MLLVIIKMLSIQWLHFTRVCSYSAKYMQHPFVTGEQVECHPVFCTSVTVSTVELNPITCYSFVYPFYNSNFSTIRKILEPLLCEVPQPWDLVIFAIEVFSWIWKFGWLLLWCLYVLWHDSINFVSMFPVKCQLALA